MIVGRAGQGMMAAVSYARGRLLLVPGCCGYALLPARQGEQGSDPDDRLTPDESADIQRRTPRIYHWADIWRNIQTDRDEGDDTRPNHPDRQAEAREWRRARER